MSGDSPQARTDVRATCMIPPFAKGGRKGGATCRVSTLLDGLSLAHPFITDQWKGGHGGYAHVIKAEGYMWDMHFEGSSPGAGATGFVLHMLGTIKDIANGTANGERAKMVPEQ